jgi:hypothetical protein
MISIPEAPVFICGHRKSGTTMLVCLLDSHPELLTYPCDSGFFYKVFPACLGQSKADAIASVIENSIRSCLIKETSRVRRPDLLNIDAIAGRFQELAEEGDGSPRSLLQSLLTAYGDFCGQSPANWKAWVEKTTSTEIYATEVAEWFPCAKFIHLIRDPRDNFGSLKSGWDARYQYQENDKRGLLQSLLDRGGLGLQAADANVAALGPDRYLIVRFEDLVMSPEPWLKRMADFIGVSYAPILKTPTVNGVPWPGNNFDGREFNSVSAANLGRWPERIDGDEAAVIESFLGTLMEKHGYDLTTSAQERARATADHYKWFNFSRNHGR